MSFNNDNQRGGGWHEGSADSASAFRARGGAEIQARAAVRALDSVRDAFLTLDSDFRIMYANAEAARINGKPVEAFLGRTHWEEWPDSVGTPVESCYRRAMADRTPVYFEHHYFVPDQLDLWAAISVYPDAEGGGLHLVYRDITERMRGEQREDQLVEALRESEERYRALVDAASQIVWTNSADGKMSGEQPGWSGFTGQVYDEYQGFGWSAAVHPEDRQVTIDEWNRSVRALSTFVWEHRVRRHDGVYRHFSVRGVPILNSDGAIREWVGIHSDVTETRAQLKREALLNQIGDSIRQSLPPEEIEALAIGALGSALAADRCYLMAVDLPRDTLTIVKDWRANGVSSIARTYKVLDMGVDLTALFASGRTLIVRDARPESERRLSDKNAGTNARVGVTSFVNVPFYDGDRIVGALGVAMASQARDWTPEDISLAEGVAGQLRSTLEAVRAQQRERNIAQQLQDALMPPPPGNLPGLALASFYRPALQEASVGGDGFDVYPVEEDCTALCVFDLSGKGLAAASAVATVRNMTRFALYNGRTVAQAVTALNRTLVEHNLLEGFATLFLGVYDHAASTLRYVNCGQEPGLIWRATTGEVEQLLPTGAVLGGFEGGTFTETLVQLLPGDVLAIFTDGLTEVGASRKDLLQVEGVSDLLGECCRNARHLLDPRSIAECLVAGVDRFARNGVRDDMALLVGVVTGVAGGGGLDPESLT